MAVFFPLYCKSDKISPDFFSSLYSHRIDIPSWYIHHDTKHTDTLILTMVITFWMWSPLLSKQLNNKQKPGNKIVNNFEWVTAVSVTFQWVEFRQCRLWCSIWLTLDLTFLGHNESLVLNGFTAPWPWPWPNLDLDLTLTFTYLICKHNDLN